MKKFVCILMVVISISLFSCQKKCEHSWKEATCQTPRFCSICGETQGVPVQHNFSDATCIVPKTCTMCGKTEGNASAEHAYVGDACKDCGLIKLSLYNYNDYIECNATVKLGDSYYDSYQKDYVYQQAKCNFEAKGNTHYKYNNVSIVIKFSHYDEAGYKQYLMNQLIVR